MKLYIYKYFFIFILGVSLAACDEEFLTESNPNLIATDNYWQNLDHTEATLNATYSTMLNHYVLSLLEESWRADMGWPGYGRPTPDNGQGKTYYFKTYTESDSSIKNKWEALYQGIFRANQVIAALENLEGSVDEERWTLQMGQARFLRGLYHFYLHTSFNNGNVVIRDRVPSSQKDFNASVSPSSEVIAFFRKDLQYAYNNLPAKYEAAAGDVGRVTSGTAATILGTSYLYQEEYANALSLFNDVIDNPDYGYGLVAPNVLFTKAGEFNKESIFEIAYNVTHRPELGQWDELSQTNRLVNQLGANNSTMPAWIQYKYKTEPMDPLDDRNYYIDAIEGKKLRNVPLRASQMVTLIEDEQTLFYLNYNVSEKMKSGATGWGFGHCKKYLNHDHLEDENKNPKGSWNSGKNVVVNRLAEVYLMRAECFIKTGDITNALADINTLRSRWGLELLGAALDANHTYNGVNYTEQTLMDHLMYTEKPLELSNEGHSIRWTDLRRWGIIKANFDRLANEVYYGVDYSFTKLDGTTGSSGGGSIASGPEPAAFKLKVDFEYDLTANNYIPELHDYLPIPLSEVTSNSSID
ncbi:RagB/SusD family nutrient uptake outer membrane protein [Flavicella sediminum]|uniref:RagB/SusD family nutrient uptake outer membrane protein n=1 Tax=Flavicella sediminum TaxID=2585141 RepID=UPI00111FADE9|nr:RagB/SusD family nutrient uptake outer membrane protein [Flavicella sediminum]